MSNITSLVAEEKIQRTILAAYKTANKEIFKEFDKLIKTLEEKQDAVKIELRKMYPRESATFGEWKIVKSSATYYDPVKVREEVPIVLEFPGVVKSLNTDEIDRRIKNGEVRDEDIKRLSACLKTNWGTPKVISPKVK